MTAPLLPGKSGLLLLRNREKPSAVRKEAETWRERLDAAVAGSVREKENGSEHVKALNDVAALYAEGLQNGWVHPLDVRAWCDSVAEAGSGYSGETVIGAMFLYGTGIKRDAVAAREWFEYGLPARGPSGETLCTCWE